MKRLPTAVFAIVCLLIASPASAGAPAPDAHVPGLGQCAGYELAWSKDGTNHIPASEPHTLRWSLGEGSDNRLDVTLKAPLQARHVVVRIAGAPEAAKAKLARVLVGDRMVGELTASGRCADAPEIARRACVDTFTVDLGSDTAVGSVRLVDLAPAGTEAWVVGLSLMAKAPKPQATVVTDPGFRDWFPLKSAGPGGWQWTIPGAGTWLVKPRSKKAKRVDTGFTDAGELVAFHPPGGATVLLVSPLDYGGSDESAAEVRAVDTKKGKVTVLHTPAAPITDARWDPCQRALVLKLDGGKTETVPYK